MFSVFPLTLLCPCPCPCPAAAAAAALRALLQNLQWPATRWTLGREEALTLETVEEALTLGREEALTLGGEEDLTLGEDLGCLVLQEHRRALHLRAKRSAPRGSALSH